MKNADPNYAISQSLPQTLAKFAIDWQLHTPACTALRIGDQSCDCGTYASVVEGLD